MVLPASNTGDFQPNTTSPDPNWPKCLQCAAFDRARLKQIPPFHRDRTHLCALLLAVQYCYDPSNPPNRLELPGRKYTYTNPDPRGVDKVEAFLSKDKNEIIGVAVALVVVIAGGFIFWWRKYRERKRRSYSRVDELRPGEDDEPLGFYESDRLGYEMQTPL